MHEPLRKFQALILPLLVFGALWFLLIKNLSLYWATDPQYSFGWFGPLLCAYLFLSRWLSRPPTEPASWGAAKMVFLDCLYGISPHLAGGAAQSRLARDQLALSLGNYRPNAIRDLFLWGEDRGYAFLPLVSAFILTALPWPRGLETFLIQGLMQIVAWVTVGLLNLSHIAALQHGNLIELKTGLLGIDEACSGVRSLQASVMVSLLLGALSSKLLAKDSLSTGRNSDRLFL